MRSAERYDRRSQEFARVINLSDAVFAIAMTLLAFKVETPGGSTPAEIAASIPHLLAFLLSFVVVANFWWHHHRLLAHVAAVEPGFVVLDLALLGAIALVPFPTELIGSAPHAVAPAVMYLSLMLLITALMLLLALRADRAGLWRSEVGARERADHVNGWAVMLATVIAALVLALWLPLAGLAILLLTGPIDRLTRPLIAGLRAPDPSL